MTSLPFDGYVIGGSLGNGKEELKEIEKASQTSFVGHCRQRKHTKFRCAGVDTLDSCYPTRVARHGTLLPRDGSIKIKSGKYSREFGVKIDEGCTCRTCRHYDRAYLWHLFKANEPIAVTLASQHNIQYMTDLMARIRQDIIDGVI